MPSTPFCYSFFLFSLVVFWWTFKLLIWEISNFHILALIAVIFPPSTAVHHISEAGVWYTFIFTEFEKKFNSIIFSFLTLISLFIVMFNFNEFAKLYCYSCYQALIHVDHSGSDTIFQFSVVNRLLLFVWWFWTIAHVVLSKMNISLCLVKILYRSL